MQRPTDKERQDHIDSVIRTFQAFILNAKTPQHKLKYTIGLQFYQVTEELIWDLNFTDKYGLIDHADLLVEYTESLADAAVPIVCAREPNDGSWESVVDTLAMVFKVRLLEGICATNNLQEQVSEKDLQKIMELFIDATNRTKPFTSP